MTQIDTSPQSWFSQSVRLLVQLHKLIASGKDESKEGDAIRDAMDYPWYQMNECESETVGGLSADLYTIGVDRLPPTEGPTEDDAKRFQAAHAAKDWPRALDELRAVETKLSAGNVAYFRGSLWAHLRQYEAAIEFLEESQRLGCDNPLAQSLLMTCLLSAGRTADAVLQADALVHEEAHPLLLLKAAQVYSLRATEVDAEASAFRMKAIETAQKGLDKAATWPLEPEFSDVLFAARIATLRDMAFDYDQLGKPAKAKQACEKALALDPDDENTLALFGLLNYPAATATQKDRQRRKQVDRPSGGIPFKLPSLSTPVGVG